MNLYVMRHGEVDYNVRGLINGVNDSQLNENGINQAKSKQHEVSQLDIDLIICSPLVRTRQTCKYANAENKPVFYEERLVERDSRSMQYEPVEKLDMNIWYDATKEVVYKDAEGFKSILDRIYVVLDEIKEKYKDKNVLLVTHGDICKAIYRYFNRDKQIDISKVEQKNCEIVHYNF